MGKYNVNLIAIFHHSYNQETAALLDYAQLCAEECKNAVLITNKDFLPGNIDPARVFCQCRDTMSTLEFAKFIADISKEYVLDNILVVSDKKHLYRLWRDLRKITRQDKAFISHHFPEESYKISASCPLEKTSLTFKTFRNRLIWWAIELPKRILPWRLYTHLAAG